MTDSCKKILELDAFRALGESRIKFIKELMGHDKITSEDISRLICETASWTDLSAESKNALITAFYSGLSDNERKRIDYILDIVSAFN